MIQRYHLDATVVRLFNLANVDFGDGYLAATAAWRGERIASFEADLRSFTDVETVVPA